MQDNMDTNVLYFYFTYSYNNVSGWHGGIRYRLCLGSWIDFKMTYISKISASPLALRRNIQCPYLVFLGRIVNKGMFPSDTHTHHNTLHHTVWLANVHV